MAQVASIVDDDGKPNVATPEATKGLSDPDRLVQER